MKYEFETIEDFVEKAESVGITEIGVKLVFGQQPLGEEKGKPVLRINAVLVLTAFDRQDKYNDYLFFTEAINVEDVKAGERAAKLEKESEARKREAINQIKKAYPRAKIIYGRILE